MAVVALQYGANVSLGWVTSYDESAEVHSEAFVLYDGTTKYAPVANAGKTMSFSGVEIGTGFIADVEGAVGNVSTVTYPGGSATQMTITDFSYSFRAYDGTNLYYDWSISFGESA